MKERRRAPDATVYRLSLYHCYLLELVRQGHAGRITSRGLAQALSVKEETVRRDISFVGELGRPGAGYEPKVLLDAFTEFLGLTDDYPIVKIGTAEMLRALSVVFPPNRYGIRPVAYFSESPEDAGSVIDDIEVRHLTDLPGLAGGAVRVALVACSPGWVDLTLDLLRQAGIEGVLLLTPALRPVIPDGMEVAQIRMPCDIKSLACHCRAPTGARIP